MVSGDKSLRAMPKHGRIVGSLMVLFQGTSLLHREDGRLQSEYENLQLKYDQAQEEIARLSLELKKRMPVGGRSDPPRRPVGEAGS